jgi:aspartate dehydrogenase
MDLQVGLFGCGTIGQEIANATNSRRIGVSLTHVYDRNSEKAQAVRRLFSHRKPTVVESPDELLTADLLIEAAGHEAIEQVVPEALNSGTDCILLSVGALADEALYTDVLEAASGGGRVLVPSGAIAGLDAIKAAAFTDELESVSLTTRKPPTGLEGAPLIEREGIDLDAISEPTEIFVGPAGLPLRFPRTSMSQWR